MYHRTPDIASSEARETLKTKVTGRFLEYGVDLCFTVTFKKIK